MGVHSQDLGYMRQAHALQACTAVNGQEVNLGLCLTAHLTAHLLFEAIGQLACTLQIWNHVPPKHLVLQSMSSCLQHFCSLQSPCSSMEASTNRGGDGSTPYISQHTADLMAVQPNVQQGFLNVSALATVLQLALASNCAFTGRTFGREMHTYQH